MLYFPDIRVREVHYFAPYSSFDVAPSGDLLVRADASSSLRQRTIAQTFRSDSLAHGLEPQSTLDRSLSAIDASGRLLWCRLEPACFALSPDGAELAYASGRDLVQLRLADGAPRLRRLDFEVRDLVYDDAGALYLLEEHQAVHRCVSGRQPERVFEADVDEILYASDALVVFRSGKQFGAYDLHWRCVRQWMSTQLGFLSSEVEDSRFRRLGPSLALFHHGLPTLEIHDPWWGGMRRHQLADPIWDVGGDEQEFRVLVGEGSERRIQSRRGAVDVTQVSAEGVESLWHERTRCDPTTSLARCGVAVLDSGEPCFFAGEHARANKTIAENNPIGAVAQIGSTLFVAARHMLVAHSVLPRDLRSSFSQQHDQPITALTTCREHLVSASVNGDAFIWTVEGSQVAARPHPAAIWDLSSSEGMLATAGDDGVVRVYRDPIASDTHERFLLGVSHVLATTKNLIAAASRDRVIMVSWRGERKWDARAHIGTIAAHPHDDLFALGTSTGEVMLARPGGYREVSTGHCPSPSLAFSPRGDRLFIGSGTPAHPGAALELELS